MLNRLFPPLNHQSKRSVNWRQEYLHLAIILMSACWLAVWMALIMGWFLEISLSTSLGLCTVHMLISLLAMRWMIHRRTDPNLQLATLLLLMGIAAAITAVLLPSLARTYGTGERLDLADVFTLDREGRVPAGPFMVLWVLFLWWRGGQIANAYTTLVRASFSVRLGILMLLVVMLSSGSDLRLDALAVVPFFFFFGLFATSLARADSLNLDRAGRATVFGRGWLISLLTLTLLVTFGGYLAALWMTGMDMGTAGRVLSTLGEGILTLVFVLVSPLLLVIQVVYNAAKGALPEQWGTILETNQATNEDPSSDLQAPWIADLLNFMSDALIVFTLITGALIVLAFLWFLFISRGQRQAYEDDERESIGTGEVVSGMQQALRDSLRRLADMLGFLGQLGLGRDFFAAMTIRRIYARMERMGSNRGYPRAPAETPNEYRRTLVQAFPGQAEDVQHITTAYIAVRYGDVPEDPATLDQVRAAWERLQNSPEPS